MGQVHDKSEHRVVAAKGCKFEGTGVTKELDSAAPYFISDVTIAVSFETEIINDSLVFGQVIRPFACRDR